MGKFSRFTPHIIACLLVAGLIAACGKKNNLTELTSSVTPIAFYSHAAALKNYSTLYTWGVNSYGQLGNGDSSGASQYTPLPCFLAGKVLGVSVGGTHTLVFKSDGSAYAWGNNGFGQLGNGTQIIGLIPTKVAIPAGTIITGTAAGGNHSLALDQSGQVWAWGSNSNGQLGDNTILTRLIPVSVQNGPNGSPLHNVAKIAAGGSHSLAISFADNAVATAYAWGYNGFGQLGQPKSFGAYSTSRDSYYPVPVVKASDGSPLTGVNDIAAGGSHSLFVTSDGKVWGCGYNGMGQLGVGDNSDRNHGVVQVVLSNVKQVAAGLDHSLALLNDGTVWAWGFNFSGQLGNGMALATVGTQQNFPVQVKIDANNPLTNIVKVIAIGNSSYAVDSGGYLWGWGDNTFGQLGFGDVINRNYAAKLTYLGSGFDLYHP